MNFAFSAVLLFILLLPPVAFHISYSHGRYQKGGISLSLAETLMASAIFAMFAHAFAFVIIYNEVRLDIVITLLYGKTDSIVEKLSNADLERYLYQFAIYNIIQLFVAFLIGKIAKWIVIHFSLDKRIETLRLYNHWWYLFNRNRTRSILPKGYRIIDMVFVDVLVHNSTGMMIYSGYLTDYICKGEYLERIYLQDVVRRNFMHSGNNIEKSQPLENKAPYHIEGHVMTIPATEIANMNVHFLKLHAPSLWD